MTRQSKGLFLRHGKVPLFFRLSRSTLIHLTYGPLCTLFPFLTVFCRPLFLLFLLVLRGWSSFRNVLRNERRSSKLTKKKDTEKKKSRLRFHSGPESLSSVLLSSVLCLSFFFSFSRSFFLSFFHLFLFFLLPVLKNTLSLPHTSPSPPHIMTLSNPKSHCGRPSHPTKKGILLLGLALFLVASAQAQGKAPDNSHTPQQK